jgi:hypothetical protein
MNKLPISLSLEESANAYCLAMANAYRLIEDGERLSAHKRFVGASGAFSSAIHELVKGFLISEAVVLRENDASGWRTFWDDVNDTERRRRVLFERIHPLIYRSSEARTRYTDAFELLAEPFGPVLFDGERFQPPGGRCLVKHGDAASARLLYEYVMGLFHAFNFYGLPNPRTQAETFWALRSTSMAAPR